MKSIHLTLSLAFVALLAACSPDEPSAAAPPSTGVTPEEVTSELDAFGQDLGRILAVVEPLAGDPSAQARRLLEDARFQKLIGDHVTEIESIATALVSMNPSERAAILETIQPALQSIEFRMAEICACGPAAEDAFAPLFVAAQEALRPAP